MNKLFLFLIFFLTLLSCGQNSSSQSAKLPCDTIQHISDLGFYFSGYPLSYISPLKIKIGNVSKWDEFSVDTTLVDRFRNQRYFLYEKEIKVKDTLFVKLAGDDIIHTIYGFKHEAVPHNFGGNNVVYECRLSELTVDKDLQSGGVVLFEFLKK